MRKDQVFLESPCCEQIELLSVMDWLRHIEVGMSPGDDLLAPGDMSFGGDQALPAASVIVA